MRIPEQVRESEGRSAASGAGTARSRARRRWKTLAASTNLEAAARISLVGLFALAILFALDASAYFSVPVTTALVFGLTFGPVIDGLERVGLPPRLGGIVTLAGIVGVFYVLFLVFAAPLEEWSARAPEALNQLRQAVFWIRDPLERLADLGEKVQEATGGQGEQLKVKVAQEGFISWALASTPALLGQFMIFVGTFYFYTIGRKSIRAGLLGLPAIYPKRLRIARVLRDVESSLSQYVLVITCINVAFGVLIGVAMWALDMPVPALWGALAAFLNYVQYIGPAAMAIILTGVALIAFDTPTTTMLPPLCFIALNVLEGQFVTPALLGSRMVVNPLVVFLSLAFWLWLWGPIGAFLAVPILIIVATVMYHALPPGQREPFAIGNRHGTARVSQARE